MAAFIPALISGVAGLAGGLLNRPQTQTTNSTTNSSSSQNGSQQQQFSSMPQYDPLQLQMRDFLLNQYFNRTSPESVNSLVGSYVNQGVNNINSSSASSEQAIKNMLASRGLSYSGAAATPLAQAESSRVGQVTQLRNEAPLIGDQIQNQRLTDFSGFLRGLPVGSSGNASGTSEQNGTQTSNTQGTVTGSGNIAGGAVSGLGSSLAYLYGKGAFGSGLGGKP